MLHRHVVALLKHRVLHVHVRPRPNDRLRRALLVEARDALRLESAFGRVENHRVLEVLVARLVERFGSFHRGLWVVARPGDVSLKALTEVHLVKVESRRCAIEADFLARLLLEVLGSCLLVPFTLSAGRVAQARDLVFNSYVRLVVHHSPIAKCLAHELFARASLGGQQTNIWIFV